MIAYKLPQPKALIASAEPSSSNIDAVFAPAFSIILVSDFFALPMVREKPNNADTPPISPRKQPAYIEENK